MNFRETTKTFWQTVPAPTAHTASHPDISLSSRTRKILSLSVSATGIICFLYTDHVHNALPYILAIAMIGIGIADTLRGVMTKEYTRRETKLTANGMMFLLLGIVILVNRANADSLIGSIWGTLGLLKGAEELNEAIYYYAKKEHFLGKMMRAGIELVLGFLLLIDPISNMHHHLTILGLELIATGWEISKDTGPES